MYVIYFTVHVVEVIRYIANQREEFKCVFCLLIYKYFLNDIVKLFMLRCHVGHSVYHVRTFFFCFFHTYFHWWWIELAL